MGVRYIGSKARVAERIVDLVGEVCPRGRFIDAFCGTGAVAAVAADRGWTVTVNDALASAVAMSVAATIGTQNVEFGPFGGYDRAVDLLNAEHPAPGFIHAQYSPASARRGGVERRYFTEANAARLDAMRARVASWSAQGLLGWEEEQLLLADLLHAANAVANISGTYGCFLRSWTSTALRPVAVRARALPERRTDLTATVGDVFAVPATFHDTLYLDPPYTKRQYSAYYHLLETIHAGDSPDVSGVTGLRPWRDRASVFCYKTRALDALTRLVSTTTAGRVLLSYSTEGHVRQDDLLAALAEIGDVRLHDVQTIGRYRPNARASAAGAGVDEYLVEVVPTVCAATSGHALTGTTAA